MSDYYIKNFYDRVKDSSWPEINSYNDFLNLPTEIQDECITAHRLPARLQELEDVNYWRYHQTHTIGYQYKNLVYVPVFKCANTYYTNFFKNQNWTKIHLQDLNFNKTIAFGLMMNPMTRRVKGITQVLCTSYNNDFDTVIKLLESEGFSNFIAKVAVLDSHTVPYTIAFGKLLNKIHWIPMELFADTELKLQITALLNANGIEVQIPNDGRKNQSLKKKQQIFTLIQNIFLKVEPGAELGLIFADDVKFYNNLLKTYALLHYRNP